MTPPLVSDAARATPSAESRARLIAIYLPQFHPIPENDAWWGAGFTEWLNVAQAKPLFPHHYQPHIPADLGFYDLRAPETRAAQAELARAHGIEGFCYWHYWFNGKRLLEYPFVQVLKSGEPKFPFSLAWANESWSRRWVGDEKEILIQQTYSRQDDVAHIHWLMQAFADARYLRVQGRPLFLIYRPRDLPEPQRTTEVFRNECVRAGLPEPFILGWNGHNYGWDAREFGCDGTADFRPHFGKLPDHVDDGPKLSRLVRNWRYGVMNAQLKLYDYAYAQALMLKLMLQLKNNFPVYPSVCVGWDNSPRRGEKGLILINPSPKIFEDTLRRVVESVQHKPVDQHIVFLNAWNEWAEGNHLEPDLKFGHGFLEAVKRVANGEPG